MRCVLPDGNDEGLLNNVLSFEVYGIPVKLIMWRY